MGTYPQFSSCSELLTGFQARNLPAPSPVRSAIEQQLESCCVVKKRERDSEIWFRPRVTALKKSGDHSSRGVNSPLHRAGAMKVSFFHYLQEGLTLLLEKLDSNGKCHEWLSCARIKANHGVWGHISEKWVCSKVTHVHGTASRMLGKITKMNFVTMFLHHH